MFPQKLRVPALTVYGLLAASSVLGIKGVSVLLVHLSLSFIVAQLRKPALSWACNLLLLSTLYIQPLQEIQVSCITWFVLAPDFGGVALSCIKRDEGQPLYFMCVCVYTSIVRQFWELLLNQISFCICLSLNVIFNHKRAQDTKGNVQPFGLSAPLFYVHTTRCQAGYFQYFLRIRRWEKLSVFLQAFENSYQWEAVGGMLTSVLILLFIYYIYYYCSENERITTTKWDFTKLPCL